MKDKKFILLCLFALFAVLFTVFFMVYVASYEEENEFTQISNSEFYATPQGKIYALIPSGGKFELKGVRADKFKVLAPGGYRGRNVGMGENAVYCGNLVMIGLDPSRARAIGNGYFTDDEISYFCSDAGERNYELGGFSEMVQTAAYAIFGADKPQSYIYKTQRVSSANLAPILDFGFAAEKAALGGEGGKVYFEGKQLEGADARALRYVKDARGRASDFYVTDGQNVYFKSSRLAVKFTAELHEAARLAGVTEIVNRLPRGWDTPVGEGGRALSGGERQRVAIARALLKQAPIVLLDEATSALDPENEENVVAAVDKLRETATILVIAHKLDTIRKADAIVQLRADGTVEDIGTHEELFARGGTYRSFWDHRAAAQGWQL